MKREKRIKVALLCLMAIVLLLSVPTLAAGSIDTGREVRLTVSFHDGETALAGAEADLFRIAAVEETGELTAVTPFEKYNVNIPGKNDAAWKTLASTLEGYILRDHIAPSYSGKTDSQGMLKFPEAGGRLEMGLYLVTVKRLTWNGTIYDAVPFMVMLPALDREANEWLYDVTVEPKFESNPEPADQTITRKVLKVWADKGHEKERPKEIVVQLLRNGEVSESVTLNADNNWRYTWEELEESDTWTVVEKELDGYDVAVTREGITFVVTNTYHKDTPHTPNPGTPGNQKLPQTGQLWWPVPVLLSGGLLFLILGLLCRRRKEHEE